MADQAIEESFKGIVGSVWQALQPLGFKKNGLRFQRQANGNVAIVEFQRSNASDSDHVRFTVNLGVVSAELARRLDPEKDVNKLSATDAHLRRRLGSLLPSKDDHWWSLSANDAQDSLCEDVVACVVTVALPYLHTFETDADLLALWRSGEAPGLTEGQRLRFLALLTSQSSEN